MRHPSIRALHLYWDQLRNGKAAPARTAIDPVQIARELGDVFLLEPSEAEFRFRYVGSRIVAAIGRSLTGATFASLWLPEAQDGARRALALASEEGEPILIGIRAYDHAAGQSQRLPPAPAGARMRWANFRADAAAPAPDRRAAYLGAGEMLLMPLMHHHKLGGRVLGALALFDARALPADGGRPLGISGTRFLGSQVQPAAGTGLVPAAIADSVIERRGHLVVMRGRNEPKSS